MEGHERAIEDLVYSNIEIGLISSYGFIEFVMVPMISLFLITLCEIKI